MKLHLVVLLFFGASVCLAEGPWSGKKRALVLLLEWQDEPALVSPLELERDLFDPNSLSLKKFFNENSAGRFDISGSVLNWKKSDLKWTQVENGGCDLKTILRSAERTFKNAFEISDYDSDRNGKVDMLFVVHSGRIAHDRVTPACAFADWSWADDSAAVFQSQGTGQQGGSLAIGFYLHEAGHLFYGLPDLYANHYHGQYGIGMWGMMGLGAWGVNNDIKAEDLFRYPAHFEPKSKEKMGWGNPRKISTSTQDVLLRAVETSGDLWVVQASPHSAKYYLEYRSKNGFSENNEGEGLLIWRDFELVQADGRDDINHGNDLGRRPLPPISENFGDASDPFPGSLGKTEYEGDGVRFYDIRMTDEGIRLSIEVGSARPSSAHSPLSMMRGQTQLIQSKDSGPGHL